MGFETKVAAFHSGDLNYAVDGDGQPVLYLHGAGGLLNTLVHDSLAKQHRLFLPTLPGFDGKVLLSGIDSMPALADFIAEFINSEIGGKCDLIGHSFGGWLAAYVALRHPSLIDLMVLEAPAGFRPHGKGGLSDNPRELLRTPHSYPEKRQNDGRRDAMVLENRQQAHHYHGGIPLDEELVAQLGAINAPTLVLYGTREEVIPLETCHILKNGLEHAYIIYVYDAAHSLEVDQPERVAGLILDFFDCGQGFIVNSGSKAA